jgi:hypothetical protein
MKYLVVIRLDYQLTVLLAKIATATRTIRYCRVSGFHKREFVGSTVQTFKVTTRFTLEPAIDMI